MVNLTRIYTRTGDRGQTRLVDMSVADKTDPRVAAYGDVDEANAAIGLALAIGEPVERVRSVLAQIQNELFDVGADLGNPLAGAYEVEPLRITGAYVERLERWCDRFSAELPKLRSFILPGGTVLGAQLHVARTITRRAERAAWRAVQAYGTEPPSTDEPGRPGGVNLVAVTYLNRLSDLLFILTRIANGTEAEVLWVPGGERPAATVTEQA